MPYGNFVHTSFGLSGDGKRDRYIDELSNLAGQETKEIVMVSREIGQEDNG